MRRGVCVESVVEPEIDVKPVACSVFERLGHERGVEPEAGRDVFGDRSQRHHVVGRRKRIVVSEVDLVLSGCVLVMRRYEAGERQHLNDILRETGVNVG